jgi:hypothetical protein
MEAAVRIKVRENWYRDLWLLLISGVVVATIIVGFGQIHDSRVRAVKLACVQTNTRHDRALNALDRLTVQRLTGGPLLPRSTPNARARLLRDRAVAKLPKAQQVQIEQQLGASVVLIETITPHEDCAARARRLVP